MAELNSLLLLIQSLVTLGLIVWVYSLDRELNKDPRVIMVPYTEPPVKPLDVLEMKKHIAWLDEVDFEEYDFKKDPSLLDVVRNLIKKERESKNIK